MILKKIEKKLDFLIKKITEYPLVELIDQFGKSEDEFVIPPIVYQTWEDNFFGKTHFKEIQKFRALNKDLSFILYNKEKRDSYMKDNWSNHEIFDVYKLSKLGVMKSDIFRHCILFQYGGYYFDISKGCKVSLRSLHQKNTEVLISNEPVDCIIPPDTYLFKILKYPHKNFLTWGLGFKKNHSIPKMMIDAIVSDYKFYVNNVFERPKIGVLSLTATGQFTKIVREYLLTQNNENIIQSGIYFNDNGIFSMKGCRVRHHLVKSYADLVNQSII